MKSMKMKSMKISVLLLMIFLVLVSSAFALVPVDVKVTGPTEVHANTPFTIQITLNSHHTTEVPQRVQNFDLYVTSLGGHVTFSNGLQTGTYWFPTRVPQINQIDGIAGWRYKIPTGTNPTFLTSTNDQLVFTLTGVATTADTIQIDTVRSLVNRAVGGSADTTATFTITPTDLVFTIAAPSYSCTGTAPTHSQLCANDNTGLSANTALTVVAACTAGTKCEYTCTDGYTDAQCQTAPNLCASVTCQNGGSCTAATGACASCTARAATACVTGVSCPGGAAIPAIGCPGTQTCNVANVCTDTCTARAATACVTGVSCPGGAAIPAIGCPSKQACDPATNACSRKAGLKLEINNKIDAADTPLPDSANANEADRNSFLILISKLANTIRTFFS